jgi:hypothetical protein
LNRIAAMLLFTFLALGAAPGRTAVAAAETPAPGADAVSVESCQHGCANAAALGVPTDGATDAWPRLQGLASRLASGDTLYLPAGTYRISQPLRMPSRSRLIGAGKRQTTLLLDRRSWANFSYSFMVTSRRTDGGMTSGVTVADLTVNGNRSNVDPEDGTPDGAANAGGGIKAGSSWTVTRVRFTNLNYFKMWVYQVSQVTVRGCQFDALGGSASLNDNIGGGQSRGVLVEGNLIDASATGKAVDLVRSSNVVITRNVVNGVPGSSHAINLEGVSGATVSRNIISHAGISVRSESAYQFAAPVHNPSKVVIRDNVVKDAPGPGISIQYDTSAHGQLPGGGNTVSGNTVSRAALAGVAVVGCGPDEVAAGDVLSRNWVVDPFTSGWTRWDTGCGSFDPVGIAISAGVGDQVTDNAVRDTRQPALTYWGISLGAYNGQATLSIAAMSGNTAPGVRYGLIVVPQQGALVTMPGGARATGTATTAPAPAEVARTGTAGAR